MADIYAEVAAAAGRVYPWVRRTPLEASPGLGPRAYLKLESEQVTGSFKARGAVNKLAALTPEQRAAGIVTASTGNHALAVAYALRTVPGCAAIPAEIFLPSSVAPVKLAALRAQGAPVRVIDAVDCVASEAAALAHARATGAVFVSPYNDAQVVGGQGTIGLEIVAQLDEADQAAQAGKAGSSSGADGAEGGPLVVLVPVGGGGMIAGIAAAVKAARPDALVIGCQPEGNACMLESVRAGRILPEGHYANDDTWSDGTAGGIEEGSVTFAACARAETSVERVAAAVARVRGAKEGGEVVSAGEGAAAAAVAPSAASSGGVQRLVDGLLTVSEAEIEGGMLHVLARHHKVGG
jgi:threonine dehydratase